MIFNFAYARVSTDEQETERQKQAIKEYCPEIEEKDIFIDKATGKNFDRPSYQLMKSIIERVSTEENQVELIIEEFDRLGRNKQQIQEELRWFKEHHTRVRILNLPTTLVDVPGDSSYLLEMVQNILIEVMGTIAEEELRMRKKRQMEGIEIARQQGKYRGRKPVQIEEKAFLDKYARWRKGEITAAEAMRLLGVKANTFYRRVALYEESGRVNPCGRENEE
ncbi:MAG: recombinase family protein [Lachnospiraceae bacterium]|jgi:DNA invertase Pin-like site-specific DNA recombinase|nr:recombinase family protein [Lachnospiraceae bacterium]